MLLFQAGCARAFLLGEIRTFFIDSSYDFANRSQVRANLLHVSDKAFFYVENEWWGALSARETTKQQIIGLADEFDKVIYPRLTEVFGSEWNPGIDGEPRITVLISRMREGAGGYFNSADEFPKTISPSSNEREMIYLNSSYMESTRAKAFLAHEFHHLINFYQKEKLRGLMEDVWLNEALSEYSGALCGYEKVLQGSNLEKRVAEFLRNPSDSLAEWSGQTTDYGPVNLFMQYLVARHGEQFLYRLARTNSIGMESIDTALSQIGAQETFKDIFANWTVANYINDCRVGTGQKYCYLNDLLPYSVLHVGASMTNKIEVKNGNSSTISDQMKDWAPRWYEFLPEGSGLNIQLDFFGQESSLFKVPYIIFYSDGSKKVDFLELDGSRTGSRIILNFGSQVSKIVVVPSSQLSYGAFSISEPLYKFSLTAKITPLEQISNSSSAPSISPSPTPLPASPQSSKLSLPDGSLIRAKGDYKVYVIAGQYKRWLQNPKVLACYPHLGWQSVIEVEPSEVNSYIESRLIRAESDSRVYEISDNLIKNWLNMTADVFTASGRSWNSVFITNRAERDLYKTGQAITQ